MYHGVPNDEAERSVPYIKLRTITKDVWLENPSTTHVWMWLRSNGSSQANAGEIGSYGYLSFNGGEVSKVRALRPLIQVTKP